MTWWASLRALAWPADSALSRAIVLLILLLLAWSLLSTLKHAVRIAEESRALARAVRMLRDWRKLTLESTEQAAKSADVQDSYPRMSLEELSAKLAEIRRTVGAERHVAKLLEAVRTVRIHRMKLNLSALQQVVERDEVTLAGVHAPRYVANFAVMLGILGTFWGLGHMVSAIGEALPGAGELASSESWANSVEQIRSVLSGMRTAFATSLVGMAASITAGLAGVYLTTRQQRLLQALEAFAVNELLPATVPTLEDDSVMEQVSAQLERSFAYIDDIARQNRQALEELGAAQAVFRSLVEDIRAITHGEAGRDFAGVLEAVVGSNSAVQGLVAELPRLTRAVENSQKALLEGLSKVRAQPAFEPISVNPFRSREPVPASPVHAAEPLVSVPFPRAAGRAASLLGGGYLRGPVLLVGGVLIGFLLLLFKLL